MHQLGQGNNLHLTMISKDGKKNKFIIRGKTILLLIKTHKHHVEWQRNYGPVPK